jgi:hypothetical protein
MTRIAKPPGTMENKTVSKFIVHIKVQYKSKRTRTGRVNNKDRKRHDYQEDMQSGARKDKGGTARKKQGQDKTQTGQGQGQRTGTGK